MRLHTIWVWREGEDAADLEDACDDYTNDTNEEWLPNAVREAVKEHGTERVRVLVVEFPDSAVQDLFAPKTVLGRVVPPSLPLNGGEDYTEPRA